MKLFLGLLLIVGGYYLALCQMTNSAMRRLTSIQQTYSAVAATADQWQQGNSSAPFTSGR